jgi:hypothetical protein
MKLFPGEGVNMRLALRPIATVCALFFACVAFAAAGSTLGNAQAFAIVTKAIRERTSYGAGCYPLVFAPVLVRRRWAFVSGRCRNQPDAVVNAILRYASGRWRFACFHGDDVMGAKEAKSKCGMTKKEAVGLIRPL